jgi:cis-3-alkyl-4-acyloxetan-2-one decarboxylase
MSDQMLPDWLRKLYPFKPHRWMTPDGAEMSYVDEGPRSDNAVLMLHGNPTWSFFYRDLIRQISPQMRCVVPDHIGMGLSDKPQAYNYTLETRIRDIAALVKKLGLTRVHLVVHDWGGAIGFGLATRFPQLIDRIVILNTAAFPSERVPRRIALCRAGGFGEWLVRRLNGFAWPATWMAMHAHALTSDEKRGYLYPYDSWSNRVAVHRFVTDIPLEKDHVSRATLVEIESKLNLLDHCPTLIIWGGRDFCFNDYFLGRWQRIYPRAGLHRFTNAGHYVLDDAGVEARDRAAQFLLRPDSL